MPDLRIGIIGAGRLGLGLGLALHQAGYRVLVWARRSPQAFPGLELRVGGPSQAAAEGQVILIAVPDDAIPDVVRELAESAVLRRDHAVLHTSGVQDRAVLEPQTRTGAAVGSLHPLQTIADPATAASALRGAYAAVEGDERASALASELARAVGAIPFSISGAHKARYHAAAAMVANFGVGVVALAGRLARSAGVGESLAGRIYLPLLLGTIRNIEALGPRGALTGPIRRGDLQTIQRHLAALGPAEREAYCALGKVTLELAREAGLPPERAAKVEELFRGKRAPTA